MQGASRVIGAEDRHVTAREIFAISAPPSRNVSAIRARSPVKNNGASYLLSARRRNLRDDINSRNRLPGIAHIPISTRCARSPLTFYAIVNKLVTA